jgi:hypothetical protein
VLNKSRILDYDSTSFKVFSIRLYFLTTLNHRHLSNAYRIVITDLIIAEYLFGILASIFQNFAQKNQIIYINTYFIIVAACALHFS